MEQTWPLGSVVSLLDTTMDIVTQHRRAGHWQPSGSHLDNLHERPPGSRKNVRVTLAGSLRLGTALRLNELGILGRECFYLAMKFADFGTIPESWGDNPPDLRPWNRRAPGRLFAAGRTWMVADPRRRDDITGLPVHRVICTADPALSSLDSLIGSPEAGLVTGDPQTLVIVDISAIGYDLCAKLSLDPAEHLITPAPEGGWS